MIARPAQSVEKMFLLMMNDTKARNAFITKSAIKLIAMNKTLPRKALKFRSEYDFLYCSLHSFVLS